MKLVALFAIARLAAAADSPAPTPPMGWNSWDSYGTGVTEAEVRANAGYMAARLKSHGWQYVVVDIQWSEPNPQVHGYRPNTELAMDQYGRLLPAPNRFPSAANGKGFAPLADAIHRQGLKFGIHIMRGIPRRAVSANLPVFGASAHAADIADPQSICRWNTDMYGVDMSKPGAQDYYNSILQLYAGWGVDYIKADDIATPFHGEEIAALHRAIQKTGRAIVLSLSPGPADVARASFYAENANLWRISGDFWDRWQDLRANFALLNTWSTHVQPGAWPDADMLPLGRIGIRAERGNDRPTRLTRDEQRTLMSLWSIARSPLMFGGDLPSNDQFTLSLLANDETIAVNQKATHSRQLFERAGRIAWISEAEGSNARYLAVFNVGDKEPAEIHVEWSDLGLPPKCGLRDLWERKDLGTAPGGYTFQVGPHASGLYRVMP
ncbi:Glycoside hydrolase, clan GH-D [Candidatus Sulfopaludibacter sp. SbA6]|nr:Glycoside hydrolase, clan GH-D [Candidatus Sulfopaludibacter sp. SbA6]